MFCPQCGAHNEDDAIYCGECGAVLDTDSEIVGDYTIENEAPESLDAIEDAETVEVEPAPAPPPRTPPSRTQPPPRPTYTPATTRTTSGLAIASMLLGIGGLTILPLLGSIIAIILGYMARTEIRQRPSELEGEGFATAGIVMGWIAIGIAILGLILGIGLGICGLCAGFGALE